MDVRLPDGTIIRGVPDDISKADLTAKLARNGYDVSKLGGAPAAAADVPQIGTDGHVVRQPKQAPEENSDTILGKIVAPVDAALSAGSSIVGGIVGSLAGAGNNIINGRQPGARQGEEFGSRIAQKISRQPSTQSGRQILETIEPVAVGLGALPTATLADLSGAIGSGVQGVRNVTAPSRQAVSNVSSRVATQAAPRAAQVARAILPQVDETTARLAAKAQTDYGIPLRPDQLYQNKVAKMIGEASEKVPLSGSKADVRQEGFNKAVIKTIGGDEQAARLTPDVFDQAIQKSGGTIGDISARTPVALDSQFNKALDSHLANVAKYETADVQKVVSSYIDEIKSKAVDGVIPGEAFRKINTAINTRVRGTSNGDLKTALGDLQESMHDALQKGLSGDDLAALQTARQQYAAAKTIEPLVAKSPTGDISPAGLMGRVTSNNAGKARMARGNGGELGDLARIGQRFLKEPASSGTAERTAAYTLLGGGAVANPLATATAYSVANIYNRFGPRIARLVTKNSGGAALSDLNGAAAANEGLSLADMAPLPPKAAPAQVEYKGVLQLADETDPAYAGTRIPESQRYATRPDVPTVEFPLRQEVLQQPEIAAAVEAFTAEAKRLDKISKNAINPKVRAKAQKDLDALKDEFGNGMWQLGIDNAQDAHGLNRPLFESGVQTRLPIKKAFDPRNANLKDMAGKKGGN